MKTALRYGLFACGAAAVLAACSSANSSPPGYCTAPSGTTVTLVYPAPNSTGIPDAVSEVILGSSAALPGSYNATLVNQSTGNFVNFGQVSAAPSPLPSPASTPSFANPVYQASINVNGITFAAGSTIGVYLNNLNSTCTPSGPIAQFQVQ